MIVPIFDPINRFLWSCSVVLYFIAGIIYLYNARNRETPKEKMLILAFGIIFIFFGFIRTVDFMRDYFIVGYFQDFVYYGDFEITYGAYDMLQQISHFLNLLTYSIFSFIIETVFKKTKYAFTMLNVFGLFGIIFINEDIFYIVGTINIFFNIIVLLMLYNSASREFQPVTLMILGATLLITIANNVSSSGIRGLGVTPLFISPVLALSGIILGLLPLTVNPDRYKQSPPILNHIVMESLLIFYIIFASIFLFIPGLGGTTFLSIIIMDISFGAATIYVFILFLNEVKKKDGIEGFNISEKPNMDLLRGFTRLKKVTEEEVSISKEKKVCLVCKNKISGHMFVCRDCESFYCEKCYGALTSLENACWACDTVLDESKPVNLEKVQEDQVELNAEKRKSEAKK